MHFELKKYRLRVFILMLIFTINNSCKEENEYDKNATIKFDLADAIYDEDMGNIKIGITLDHIRNEYLNIKANVVTLDTTTYRDIDFQLSSQTTINPFNNKGYFLISITDDKLIDLDDQIEITLIPPMQNKVSLSTDPKEQKFRFKIRNNDNITVNKFQADLTWRRKKTEDIPTDANLNLYIQTNVVITNGVVTDIGETFTSSEETKSFKTINLFDNDPDQEYYIVVYFNLTFLYEVINYTLTLNGFGFNQKNFGKVLNDTDLGSAIFYGPFYKSGNKILGAGRSSEKLNEYIVTKEQLKKLGFTKE